MSPHYPPFGNFKWLGPLKLVLQAVRNMISRLARFIFH